MSHVMLKRRLDAWMREKETNQFGYARWANRNIDAILNMLRYI